MLFFNKLQFIVDLDVFLKSKTKFVRLVVKSNNEGEVDRVVDETVCSLFGDKVGFEIKSCRRMDFINNKVCILKF